MSFKKLKKEYKGIKEQALVSAVKKFLPRYVMQKAKSNPAEKAKLLDKMIEEARKFDQFIDKTFIERHIFPKMDSIYAYKKDGKTSAEIASVLGISVELADAVSNDRKDHYGWVLDDIKSIVTEFIEEGSKPINADLIFNKLIEKLGVELFKEYAEKPWKALLVCINDAGGRCDTVANNAPEVAKLIINSNKILAEKKAESIYSRDSSIDASRMKELILENLPGLENRSIKGFVDVKVLEICQNVIARKKIEYYRINKADCGSDQTIKVAPILTKDDYDICNNPSTHGLTSDERSDLRMCFDAPSLAKTCSDIIGSTTNLDDFHGFFTP